MNKKTNLIVLFSLGAIVTASCFAIFATRQSMAKVRSSVGDYTITINPDDITTNTESSNGQVVVKTDQLKNDVKINFEKVKRDGANLVILEDGFIANAYDSQIRSIKNIVVYGGNQVYNYDIGWESSASVITYVENGYQWASGADFDLSSFVPNYFKMSYRAVEVEVSKIVIEFDKTCVVGENPSVIKDGLKYRKVVNDHAILVGFAGSPFADVVVADTVEGLPVTEIADMAFYYNTNIKSIDFGANVTRIGYNAFSYATNLETVASFANITDIAYGAFQGTSLKGDISFSPCLKTISGAAFSGTELTSVTFADTGNPYISDGSFRDIHTLTSVHIGSECTSFYEDFLYDDGLETITVGAGNTVYSAVENVLFDDANKVVRSIAANRSQTSFTLPSGYEFKTYCALGNQTLETLTLNETADSIPDYSFHHCPNLKNINFGSYNGLIIKDAFFNCEGLTKVTIPSNVSAVYQRAFASCTNLETVVFEEGCTTIHRGAFRNCEKLKNVLLPTTLTSLGQEGGWASDPVDVFDGCTALTKICTRLASGTYSGAKIEAGWDGGRSFAYESVSKNLDGNHWRMVDGTPRIWAAVNVTFKVYRNDIGTGYAIYFLGTFNEWTANEDSRGEYKSDHWELTIELISYETYEFKGAVSSWDSPTSPVYEAGSNHSFTPDDAAFEYVIDWQY